MKNHWEGIYQTKPSTKVSWYKSYLDQSIQLIVKTGVNKHAPIIDVGGGVSTLVDDLLNRGFENVTVLDISPQAIKISKERLASRALQVHWMEEDITKVSLQKNAYQVWHDRALFHFLVREEDRKKYVALLNHALKPGGYAIISTFGLNGPAKCSGLDVVRYSPETLKDTLGCSFKLIESFTENHFTPIQVRQEFLYCMFEKSASESCE